MGASETAPAVFADWILTNFYSTKNVKSNYIDLNNLSMCFKGMAVLRKQGLWKIDTKHNKKSVKICSALLWAQDIVTKASSVT